MTLRLKINAIVSLLTLLFVGAMLALTLRSMRESVHEEVVAAVLAGSAEAPASDLPPVAPVLVTRDSVAPPR